MHVQTAFEEHGFRWVYTSAAAPLALQHQIRTQAPTPAIQAACGLVLDAGFSYTHAVPVFDGRLLPEGVRRLNLGGKALTNYFKELVSYRSGRLLLRWFSRCSRYCTTQRATSTMPVSADGACRRPSASPASDIRACH